MATATNPRIKQTHRRNSCLIYPLYEDEGYWDFLWWEIYYCDCTPAEQRENDICDCLYESEPDAVADTLDEAFAFSKQVRERKRPIRLFGMTFR